MSVRARRAIVRLPREERISDIERAAREAFSRSGYDSASMADIAARAGVAEGTIYKFFENKRDLLLRVMQRWYEDMIAQYQDQLAGIQGARNRIRFVIWRHLRSIEANPDLCRLYFSEVRLREDYYSSPIHQLNRQYTKVATGILREGIAAGEIRADISVPLVRDMIFGTIEHHVSGYLAGRVRLDAGRIADELANLVMSGTAAAAPAARPLEETVCRLEAAAERLELLARGAA